MKEPVHIQPFDGHSTDALFEHLLAIQVEEFGMAVAREDQPDVDDIPGFYQKGAGNFWVATTGDKIIGTIGLKDIGNAQMALRKMFVHADYRGTGVAQHLLDTAVRWARDKSTSDIFLGTTPHFPAAHRFYEKNGFRIIDPSELPPAFPVMFVDKRFYRYRLDAPVKT